MLVNEAYKLDAPFFPKNKTYLVNGYTSGFFNDLWQLLEKKLNFTTKFYKPLTRNWGDAEMHKNGTLITTGIIGAIHEKKFDVAVTPLTLTKLRYEAVSFLPALVNLKVVVAIPSASIKESIDYTIYTRPLHVSLWISILITVIASSFSKSFCLEGLKSFFMNSYKYFWDSLRPFFGGSSSSESSSSGSYNAIIMTTLLSGYIIWIAYNASLTSELMVVKETFPFKDMDTIPSPNWRYCTILYKDILGDIIFPLESIQHQQKLEYWAIYLQILKVESFTMSTRKTWIMTLSLGQPMDSRRFWKMIIVPSLMQNIRLNIQKITRIAALTLSPGENSLDLSLFPWSNHHHMSHF